MGVELGDHRRVERDGFVWLERATPFAGVARVVFTTRLGGLSRAPYDQANLGFHVGDVGERVRLNRLALLRALGRKLRDPVVGEQVHGVHARQVGALHAGTRWEQQEPALAATDALVTDTPRLPLVTMVADCLPIALVDPEQRVAAAVHAGWRGLAGTDGAGILQNTLALMSDTWGSKTDDLAAWIGPAIRPCCYEVGPEVAGHFPAHATSEEGDRSRLDLRAAAVAILRAAGLREENITGLPLCTSCTPDLFFSHRRATLQGQEATGRQAMLLYLEASGERPEIP